MSQAKAKAGIQERDVRIALERHCIDAHAFGIVFPPVKIQAIQHIMAFNSEVIRLDAVERSAGSALYFRGNRTLTLEQIREASHELV